MSEFSKPKVPDTETVDGLLSMYLDWLKKNGIDPSEVPFITMSLQDYEDFRSAKSTEFNHLRQLYKIPSDDQQNCEYAIIRIPDSPSQLDSLLLVDVTDRDFGTTIDIPQGVELNRPPKGPNNPDLLGGMTASEDIGDTLAIAGQELRALVEKIMKGQTSSPLNTTFGDIGIRAGAIAPGQQDAYVWKVSPFANAVSLTINFPFQYDCVAIIRGQETSAGNGKLNMAQILKPSEVFKIQGDDLQELQKIYFKIFAKPDFALTEEQRVARITLFNDSLAALIAEQAQKNKDAEEAERINRRRRSSNQNTRQIGGSY